MSNLNPVVWSLLFIGYGYLLGAVLIGGMMIVYKVRESIHTGRLPRIIGEIVFLATVIVTFAGMWAHTILFASTFKDHATTLNTALMFVGLTGIVIGLAKILSDINFFQTQDRANPRK